MRKSDIRLLKREAAKLGIEVHWHGYGLQGMRNMVKWHRDQGLDQEAADLAAVCDYLELRESLSQN